MQDVAHIALPAPHQRRAIRERIGISQRTVAETLGVSQATLYRWESGMIAPPALATAKYAELLTLLDAIANAIERLVLGTHSEDEVANRGPQA